MTALKIQHPVSAADISAAVERFKTASRNLTSTTNTMYDRLSELVELQTEEPDRTELRDQLEKLGLVLTATEATLASQDRIVDEVVKLVLERI